MAIPAGPGTGSSPNTPPQGSSGRIAELADAESPRLLAYPFRYLNNGRAAVVLAETDESDAQEIAFLLLTHAGERTLAAEYGAPDPTYDTTGVSEADIAASIAAFGPPVEVTAVTQTPTADGMSAVEITFTR